VTEVSLFYSDAPDSCQGNMSNGATMCSYKIFALYFSLLTPKFVPQHALLKKTI